MNPQNILKENNLLLNICSCNSGFSRFFSTKMNAIKEIVATVKPSKIIGSVKPRFSPSLSATKSGTIESINNRSSIFYGVKYRI